MLEASEYMSRGRKLVLVLQEIGSDTLIHGQRIEGRELADLNRGRAYLEEIAIRYATVSQQTLLLAP